jgi:hypothetical protein
MPSNAIPPASSSEFHAAIATKSMTKRKEAWLRRC